MLSELKYVRACARISFIVSLACSSPLPSIRSNRRIFTCRNGSVIPDTSCSGLYPVVTSDFKLRTSKGTACLFVYLRDTNGRG